MIPTLEVRWFLSGPIPDAVQAWFDALGPPVETETRTDRYLIPTESEDLGLKVREGRVEAKQRTASGTAGRWGRAVACPEAWRKWALGLATDAPLDPGWADVPKTRRQRWRQFQAAACALELATVTLGGDLWWSVCLEASGGGAEDRQRVLHHTASEWLDRPDAPTLPDALAMGYPAWLHRRAGARL